MNPTKVITGFIYLSFLIAIMLLKAKDFQFYYVIVFAAIQMVLILKEYIVTNRKIPNEAHLVKNSSPFSLNDFIWVLSVMVVLSLGFNFFFKVFEVKYLAVYIVTQIISGVVQFLIIRGKETATILIVQNKLIINDLFLQTFHLENLTSISFDGFEEKYKCIFANGKYFTIKPHQYRQNHLDKFIALMVTKSKFNVVLSENISAAITAINVV